MFSLEWHLIVQPFLVGSVAKANYCMIYNVASAEFIVLIVLFIITAFRCCKYVIYCTNCALYYHCIYVLLSEQLKVMLYAIVCTALLYTIQYVLIISICTLQYLNPWHLPKLSKV